MSAENEDDTFVEQSMPLPKYFAELFEEFEDLRRFDLKDVIYDRQVQELFMLEVRD